MSDLVERVAAAVVEVSAEVVEPRFGALAAGDVHAKSPGELVTVADLEAEAQLTRRLADLAPGVPIVGEESCAADPARRDLLDSAERAWLVDPVDGTANFVAGTPDWAVMVALVARGETVATWIWAPMHRHLHVAERGAGATVDGEPLTARSARRDPMVGAVRRRFLDEATATRVDANLDRFTEVRGTVCVGTDYPDVIVGELDFILYWRTLPWDHAPGVLLAEEAGARARRLDGSSYRPGQTGTGLLLATDGEAWDRARAVLGLG